MMKNKIKKIICVSCVSLIMSLTFLGLHNVYADNTTGVVFVDDTTTTTNETVQQTTTTSNEEPYVIIDGEKITKENAQEKLDELEKKANFYDFWKHFWIGFAIAIPFGVALGIYKSRKALKEAFALHKAKKQKKNRK
jgi:hypothetical protein